MNKHALPFTTILLEIVPHYLFENLSVIEMSQKQQDAKMSLNLLAKLRKRSQCIQERPEITIDHCAEAAVLAIHSGDYALACKAAAEAECISAKHNLGCFTVSRTWETIANCILTNNHDSTDVSALYTSAAQCFTRAKTDNCRVRALLCYIEASISRNDCTNALQIAQELELFALSSDPSLAPAHLFNAALVRLWATPSTPLPRYATDLPAWARTGEAVLLADIERKLASGAGAGVGAGAWRKASGGEGRGLESWRRTMLERLIQRMNENT